MSLTVADVIKIIEEYKDDPPDFLQKHGAWVLTVVGVSTACLGTIFAYFLKSRCKRIKLGCLECDREVPVKEPTSVVNPTEQAP
jgi:hypothetical protein